LALHLETLLTENGRQNSIYVIYYFLEFK